jgi:hypothetical protein
MARGRGKSAIACLLGAIVAGTLLAGCGAEEHENEPRPAIATQITMGISRDKVSLSPVRVGVVPPRLLEQALQEGVKQNTPLLVWITIANLTNFNSHIEITGPSDKISPLVVANGTASFKAFLPTGDYLVSAADVPGAIAARLNVGPDRTSSADNLGIP